ncbi:hypothetical protein [Mycoplasma sp. 3686d]|uniref:hypothetical protein n=1 Tax=Mycoplasma sp. 3686d TaxID=2967300 RepID=UPI00211BD219|nr:hypothetical protein [Mycoplasma sp. 3686d]UUM24866.1 hypothetical protein NPA12_00365 [Mycoplasma sp. 3686d]
MSLTNKLLKIVLIGVPALAMITTSCSISIFPKKNKDYLESLHLKTPYFINLIRMKQQDQGIEINNSIIFDQFVESLYEKAFSRNQEEKEEKKHENFKKYFRYEFFENKELLIKSGEDFSNNIINKINSLYRELKLDKTLSDSQIKKIFEADFLKSQSLENVLKNNNILILQSFDDRSSIGLEYALKEERKNHINILSISPLEIKQKASYSITTDIKPYRSVFNVILLPKDKEFKIKMTTESENNQLLSDLYREYNLKAEQFYDWYHGGYVLGAISKIQNKQGIIYKQNLLLNNLTDESIKDLSLDSGLKIIKDPNHFNEFIIEPIQKVAQKLNSTLTNEAIINDFETNYLSGKKLDNVLKNSDIIVQRTIQKGNILSLNNPDRLVKLPSSSSLKINLTFINNRELEFNFIDKLEIKNRNRDKIPKIYYQVLIVPKGTQVEIKDKLNFKETNDFLLLNK